MSDDKNEEGADPEDSTYTQIGCCAVGDYTSKPMRLSLRARLEQEREERKQQRNTAIGKGIRKLFS